MEASVQPDPEQSTLVFPSALSFSAINETFCFKGPFKLVVMISTTPLSPCEPGGVLFYVK